jgi:hypothetical protein
MKTYFKEKTKKKPLSKAKQYQKLTTVFNRWIRLRDCADKGGANCISCGLWFEYKQLQAGHYWHSKTSILRFDERNVNVECGNCNTFDHNHLINYRKGLVEKIGEKELEKMLSIKHVQLKMSPTEIKEKILCYKERLKELQR